MNNFHYSLSGAATAIILLCVYDSDFYSLHINQSQACIPGWVVIKSIIGEGSLDKREMFFWFGWIAISKRDSQDETSLYKGIET